jgi:hypothetical protein
MEDDFVNAELQRNGRAHAAETPRCRKLRLVHLPILGVVTSADS